MCAVPSTMVWFFDYCCEYISWVFIINCLLYLTFNYDRLCPCVFLHNNVPRRPTIMLLDKVLAYAPLCFP